ncbi:hypothetical protein [Nocardia abscessus]|uniref:hypothetical protein n=1 Tax=Nocardia abscessus TaxID=120957 RepID=UPI002455DBC7|nr:hypothetical protein [Nocardia abscessus]
MAADVFACLIFRVRWKVDRTPSACGWFPGPLPVPIPNVGAAVDRGGESVVADRSARTAYFSARVHDALYGAEDTAVTIGRWHRPTIGELPAWHGAIVHGWELLLGENGGYAVAHVELSKQPVDVLSGLTTVRGESRRWLSTLVDDVAFEPMRPRVVTHLCWTSDRIPEPTSDPTALASWSTVQRWQWFLASGTSAADGLPDPGDPGIFADVVHLSNDWRALILRDGVTYTALTSADATDFHAVARTYVRSIHLDAVLLGSLQLNALHRIADRIADIRVHCTGAGPVELLEAEILDTRAKLWWNNISERGVQVAEVLRAFQNQHRMTDLYAQVVADLDDISRYLHARRARLEDEALVEAQARRRRTEERHRVSEDRERRNQTTIAVISFLLLPFAVTFSGAAVLTDPSSSAFAWSIAVALVLSLILVTVSTLRAR